MQKVLPGDVYWAKTKSDIPHPHLVIDVGQDLVVVCQITTNQSKSNFPGVIVLDIGEGNLMKPSIIETSKVAQISITELDEFVGRLSDRRVEQVLSEIEFIKRSIPSFQTSL